MSKNLRALLDSHCALCESKHIDPSCVRELWQHIAELQRQYWQRDQDYNDLYQQWQKQNERIAKLETEIEEAMEMRGIIVEGRENGKRLYDDVADRLKRQNGDKACAICGMLEERHQGDERHTFKARARIDCERIADLEIENEALRERLVRSNWMGMLWQRNWAMDQLEQLGHDELPPPMPDDYLSWSTE